MMSEHDLNLDSEELLNEILLNYVEAIERGVSPSREELLVSYPLFRKELNEFFTTRDRVDKIAIPLRVTSTFSAEHPGHFGREEFTSHDAGLHNSTTRKIGDFRLIREVGRGGMGVVYEAEQISLRRHVALKVLPFASAVDGRLLQRFRNEAQAAGQLHHSNIVPVYAVGTETGVHFYAMQFIEGQSLAQLLAEMRSSIQESASRGSNTPQRQVRTSESTFIGRSGLSTGSVTPYDFSTQQSLKPRESYRKFAEMIRQVADALEYAHQVGVIHRDIKPANLLLDSTGRLWITDFGLALIRSDSGLTATGELVGTVRYMSPEQALGKGGLVDHRADVYSLGITLYELLTLRPAFDGSDRHMLLRQLADEDPPAPRSIESRIPAELETIVLKATAKFPADRYASAREFAEDLRRFLNDQPILARRPTLIDRATKWVRRHREVAISVLLGLILITLGLAVSTAVIAHEHANAKAAYQRERAATERERERAKEAEDHYLRTRRAVDLIVEMSEEGLLDFPPLAPLRQRLLEAAVVYYQELSDHRNDAIVQRDLAESRSRLDRLQNELADVNEMNTFMLLNQPVVRKHLSLTDSQLERIQPILDQLISNRNIDPEELKGGRIEELAAKFREEFERVLTASQTRQLRQVYLQIPGPHAFSREIIDSLGLTPDQQTQVREIQADASRQSLKVFATSHSRKQASADVSVIWKNSTDQILAILTPDQRRRWAEMTGPPVDGDVFFPLMPETESQ